MAVVGEDRQQVRRGQEAGTEVVAGGPDQGHQVVGGLLSQLVGDEAETQCAHQVGLVVRYDATRLVEVLGAPGVSTTRALSAA
jgi:hypothetical protein